MDIDSVRVESSLWIGNKRYRAFLSGWYFSWTEIDKRNREKKTGTNSRKSASCSPQEFQDATVPYSDQMACLSLADKLFHFGIKEGEFDMCPKCPYLAYWCAEGVIISLYMTYDTMVKHWTKRDTFVCTAKVNA